MEFIKIRLKDSSLKELGLPNIDYPVTVEALSEGLDNDNLLYSQMLFGLQNIDNITPEIINAEYRLAELLSSPNDSRDTITVSGNNWWLELGPINHSKEMVTIQKQDNLIAILQPRDNGKLRISTYTMLDKKCLYYLIGMSVNPHPQYGVCMRENNWEYVKDQSTLISNAYADKHNEAYLSYWEFGLGISYDKSIVQNWYEQRKLKSIKPQITAIELGVYYMNYD